MGHASEISLRKSLWSRILSRIQAWKSDIEKVLEPQGGVDSVAFSISFIALSAKLAKADGQVTRDEVTMFRRIFVIPPEEEARAAKVYNLCRENVTGFESYARKMHRTLGEGADSDAIRADVLDGLFHIAMADGEFHPNEEAFLETVSEIFEIESSVYLAMIARHVPDRTDPFAVLELGSDSSLEDIKLARRRLAKENHPDILIARGLPEEMVRLASDRLVAINEAFEVAKGIIENRPEDSSFEI
jgi:DnaJ like chaperone protein